MKKRTIIAAVSSLILVSGMLSCVKRVNNGEQAREDYVRSLADSVEIYRQEIDSCNQQITILRDKAGELMHGFSTIANPREVGSYIIPEGFAKRYPPKSTALIARIDDNGCFELVAALSGRHFDRITVQAPSASASTEVVPNDQALNYRTAELTTVLFSGKAAEEVGALIADNSLNPLTVVYEEGKTVQNWKLPTEYADEIAQTWQLYQTQHELNRLERRIPMLHEKINLLRVHMDKK